MNWPWERHWQTIFVSNVSSSHCSSSEETELRIKEISHALGYPSQSTFCQIFKNQYRVSPSEYRLLCRRSTRLAS
ncbi:AraC family transcriptional regulator [Edwardsiella ictaluri]